MDGRRSGWKAFWMEVARQGKAHRSAILQQKHKAGRLGGRIKSMESGVLQDRARDSSLCESASCAGNGQAGHTEIDWFLAYHQPETL